MLKAMTEGNRTENKEMIEEKIIKWKNLERRENKGRWSSEEKEVE